MNVTPEMLLFLAGKMGLEKPYIFTGAFAAGLVSYGFGGYLTFKPHTDDAQFGRLVVWASQGPTMPFIRMVGAMRAMPEPSTPDSIRAAAVVAICRALGFDAAMEADK